MTTPTPVNPPQPAPAVVVTPVNDPNKAIAALLTTIVGVIVQWLSTGTFTLGQEGATAIVGAVATILVYLVDNRKKLFIR